MRAAIVVSTIGFHWEELFDAYKEFQKAGVAIDLYTVDGKPGCVDPKSVERRPVLSLLGLGIVPDFGPETTLGREILYRLKNQVKPVSLLTPTIYETIYLPGGHGCLFDVNQNLLLQEKLLEFYREGKIISAVCHATSALAFTINGKHSIIKGKKVTGFPDWLDDVLIKAKWIHKKFLPLPFSNERKIKEAGGEMNTTLSIINPTHHVVDLPFITGTGPKAAKFVIRKVIENILAGKKKAA